MGGNNQCSAYCEANTGSKKDAKDEMDDDEK